MTGYKTFENYYHINGDIAMEKRQSRRFNVFFNSGFCSWNVKYTGFVGNLSENGLYMRISSTEPGINFHKLPELDLKLKLSSEEMLNLICRLVWMYEIPHKSSANESAYNLGMKILGPFPEYQVFYEDLAMKSLNECINRYLH